jgi:hypothetical protein
MKRKRQPNSFRSYNEYFTYEKSTWSVIHKLGELVYAVQRPPNLFLQFKKYIRTTHCSQISMYAYASMCGGIWLPEGGFVYLRR